MSDSTSVLDLIAESQSNKEVTCNAALNAASPAMLFARRDSTSAALIWGYTGGRMDGVAVANDTVSLTASDDNYIVVDRSTLAVTVSTTTTNWNDTTTYGRAYLVVTGASTATSWEDHRAGADGILSGGGGSGGGYINIPQNSQSTAYTTVLGDQGKHLLHPSADTTARTFTIDSNANVAYPLGTAITFVNENGAGTLTIAITSDTMRLAGAGTTGSRTLAANGIATALKITSTSWIISGTGLT